MVLSCRRIWARLRMLEVPTMLTWSMAVEMARKSAGESLCRMAVVLSPFGRLTGISFMLWTAASISPRRMASSSAFTKSPWPPISWRGTPVSSSPWVRMMTVSTSTPCSARILATRSVWLSASLLPRVPITRDMPGTPVQWPRYPHRCELQRGSSSRTARAAGRSPWRASPSRNRQRLLCHSPLPPGSYAGGSS